MGSIQISRVSLSSPIFQAPTGSIAGPELCAAVSGAGGLGAVGLTWTSPSAAHDVIARIRERTSAPFQANFVLHFPPQSIDVALDLGVPVITFSWGMEKALIRRCHTAGAVVGVQITSAAGGRKAIDAGADFVICQGLEAGGHVQSTSPLAMLLAEVVTVAGGIPVVAAGGIATVDQVRDALGLGATAVMCGTRFVATRESRAHDVYKQALLNAREGDTALTLCFDGGWPYAAHRVLRNSTFCEWEAAGSPPIGMRPGEGESVGQTADGQPIFRYEDTAPRNGMMGAIEAMCLYAGTSVDAIHSIESAAEVVAALTPG